MHFFGAQYNRQTQKLEFQVVPKTKLQWLLIRRIKRYHYQLFSELNSKYQNSPNLVYNLQLTLDKVNFGRLKPYLYVLFGLALGIPLPTPDKNSPKKDHSQQNLIQSLTHNSYRDPNWHSCNKGHHPSTS